MTKYVNNRVHPRSKNHGYAFDYVSCRPCNG